jgi:hypothetical protein
LNAGGNQSSGAVKIEKNLNCMMNGMIFGPQIFFRTFLVPAISA